MRGLAAGGLAGLGLAGMLLVGAAAAEDWQPCPGGDWAVTGAEAGERALVCTGVAAAAELLGACGLEVKQAGRVRLLDALPALCDTAAYGVFDAAAGEIRLGRPALCLGAAPTGSVFQSLPVETAFVALAAHEAAHALLFAAGLGGERRMEHEYIAGVVQHGVLSEGDRAVALAATGVSRPLSEAEFNPVLLGLAPAQFAAKAWLDFEAREDGCGLLRALANGTARLPELPEL